LKQQKKEVRKIWLSSWQGSERKADRAIEREKKRGGETRRVWTPSAVAEKGGPQVPSIKGKEEWGIKGGQRKRRKGAPAGRGKGLVLACTFSGAEGRGGVCRHKKKVEVDEFRGRGKKTLLSGPPQGEGGRVSGVFSACGKGEPFLRGEKGWKNVTGKRGEVVADATTTLHPREKDERKKKCLLPGLEKEGLVKPTKGKKGGWPVSRAASSYLGRNRRHLFERCHHPHRVEEKGRESV